MSTDDNRHTKRLAHGSDYDTDEVVSALEGAIKGVNDGAIISFSQDERVDAEEPVVRRVEVKYIPGHNDV